jgi:hypothetical protein
VNLKGGKGGRKQTLISTDLLLYQSHFLEAMMEKIREVVYKRPEGNKEKVGSSKALGSGYRVVYLTGDSETSANFPKR